ncbi:peptidase U37 [Shimia litoralis]|uniref:Peptidase U37 n=2 Tax=Shimia litoralis TaxID=420403 RepID=A0A4U7N4V7_9RHOB|nr:peptidase U37 [Shimia litoralis]
MRSDVRFVPESIDEATRSVELVWSAGATVRRRDGWTGKPYDEVLSLDPGHVDLARLNGGAPLLNAHGAFDLGDVIGVVERAWIEAGGIETGGEGPVGRARVRFSERADVAPIWADVQAGIIRNVSVGYSVRAFEISEEEGRVPLWRAVDWQPMELSAVPVGADAGAGFRSPSGDMPPCQLRRFAKAQPPIPKNEDQSMDKADTRPPEADADMEGARDHGAAGGQAPSETNATGEGTGVRQRAALSQEAGPLPAENQSGAPEPAQRNAVAAASPTPGAPSEGTTNTAETRNVEMRQIADEAMRGERARIAGIQDVAKKLGVAGTVAEDLVASGTPLEEARVALIDAAADRDARVETRSHLRMGGQDAVETRRAAVEEALLHRHDPGRFALGEAARDWRGLSLIEVARAFLEAEGVRVRGLSRDEIATRALHSTSDFPQILSNVTNKTLRAAYDVAPRTFAPIARRTSVADFKNVHRLQLGEAPQLEKVSESGEYKRGTIGEAQETYRIETFGKVIGITRQVLINDDLDAFTRVPALFGTAAATLESDVVWDVIVANAAMADGKGLFHAGHNNLAGTGAALDVAGLAKARTAMSHQKGIDGKTTLNIRPSFLVVPTSLELNAEQLLAQTIVPTKSGDVVPSSMRALTVVSEPRLDPASGAVPWYLFANPAAIDTIEYAYLEGQEGVAMETRMGFDVDGIEIRARLDFGAKAIDWRGMFKNPGVALS